MHIYHIVLFLQERQEAYYENIEMSLVSFRRCKNLIVGDHTHHNILPTVTSV